VAFVCGNLAPERDGVADYTLRLVEALAERIDPVLVTAGPVSGLDLPPGARLVRATGGRECRRGGPGGRGWRGGGRGGRECRWGAGDIAAVAAALRRSDPDLVHVQFAPSAYRFSPTIGVLPLLLGRRLPLVTTLHEYAWWSWPARVPAPVWRALESRRWWDRETLTLAPRSDRVVVTNDDHARAVLHRLGIEAARVPVGPNIVPPDGSPASPGGSPGRDAAARLRVRESLRLPVDAWLLIFFGFVHPVKGVRYLIEALARLRADDPDVRLVVAGGFTSLALPSAEASAFRRELEGTARAAGVAGAVSITGHLPAAEISVLLRAADVAVLPFTGGVTTKSGALVAALAHGLPAVVTAADPPDPLLVDGRTAVVVGRTRDPVALAGGLRRLLADPGLRTRVAAGGAALVADRGWPRIATDHLTVYAEVLAGDRRPAPRRPREDHR
jgi:glycosyltransferase involved in cell wall biosynthesis